MWRKLFLIFLLSGVAYGQGLPPLGIQDEGGTESKPVFTIDCVGPSIECTHSGKKATITIAGGGVGVGTVQPGVEGFMAIYTSNSTTVNDSALLYDNGTNIGIGSTVPQSKLDVVGTVTATAFSGPLTGAVTGNASTATALAANGGNCAAGSAPLGVDASGAAESCTDYEEDLSNSAGLAGALSDEVGTGFAVFNASPNFTGNIGIGSTSPRAVLDVNGTAYFGGAVTGISLNEIENLTADKTFTLGSNNLTFALTTPSSGVEINVTGAFTDHAFHVHQSIGNPGTTSLVHLEAADNDVTPFEIVHSGTPATGYLVVGATEGDGGTKFKINGSGNVGVGSTSPEYKLDVVGTGDIDTLTEGGNAVYNASETPGGELGGTWASPTIDDSITVTGWALGTSSATAFGIGTVSPTADLAVGAGTPGSIDGTNDVYILDDLEVDGVIYGDGSGITGITASAGGSDTYVQFNDGGSTIGGDAGLTYNKTTDVLSVVGGIGIGTTGYFVLPAQAGPTVDAAGEIAVDTTDDQLVFYGGAKRVLPYVEVKCITIENLAAADDNIYVFSPADNVTLVNAWCHCSGTCTTEADLTLETRQIGTASTVDAVTGTVDCEDEVTGDSKTALSGDGATVDALDIVRFDTGSPSPETDTYQLCIEYTTDSQ